MTAPRGKKLLKLADRWLGIPLLAPFALRSKRVCPTPERVRRIGLLKSAAIGDTLLLAGFHGALRRAFPNATMVMISGQDNAGAARLLPEAAEEHVIVSPRAPVSAARSIRAAKLDILIDFGSWPRFDAWLAAVSGATYSLGFTTPSQARHFAYDATVEHSRNVHERENYRRLLASLGIETTFAPRLEPPRILSSDRIPTRPFVLFQPWSSGYLHSVKEWPNARWIELGRRISARGYSVVLSAGRGDTERTAALAHGLRAAGADVVDASGVYDLLELADVLAASELVVSVNTGIMHLAAQLGARTVSLEGPTPVHRWGPLGPRTRSVVSTLPGCGYLHLGFEYDGQRRDCMDGISVDAVMGAIDELLSS